MTDQPIATAALVQQEAAALAASLAPVYKDLHANPELSFAEHRTAALVADRITGLGYGVATGIGGTGVVGVLENGEGPTVLLRADMDGLPVLEETGLDYASVARGVDPEGNDVPVMHACGHDVHVTCLLGAAELLAARRDTWSGTLVVLFQPAEEAGGGAQAMVDDDLYARVPKPDIVFGQHVGPLPAGVVGTHAGPSFAATDAYRVTFHGRGGHGSRPQSTIDPIVMAASAVVRLQSIVSREVAGTDTAVLTVGTMHAGTKNNIIPDTAQIGVNIRSYEPHVRDRVVGSMERIIRAEAAASGAEREPVIEHTEAFPVLVNDPAATGAVTAVFADAFGANRVVDPGLVTGSEDVGMLATAADAPIVYWILGGADPQAFAAAYASGRMEQDLPGNHSSKFAPLIHPTLDTGIAALSLAALSRLFGTAATA
ncbi:amidohydrolase [Plantibacter sp. MCCC 1A11337]|uniref:amidohydrolase n=1 Tax=Plantibacter sp. MCCC 1A11337 TaxID=2736644 RepID=UPI0015821F8F|nr:amidohydrolase [Plantibacter sp. MCCC 1A11337]NUJ88109.1 amidohydrolase [Plantibacter sp. MCCC 1A11337]